MITSSDSNFTWDNLDGISPANLNKDKESTMTIDQTPPNQTKQPEDNPSPLAQHLATQRAATEQTQFSEGRSSDRFFNNAGAMRQALGRVSLAGGSLRANPPADFGRYGIASSQAQALHCIDPAAEVAKAQQFTRDVISLEMFFADYMREIAAISPLDGKEHTEDEKQMINGVQSAVRELREFIVAQMNYRRGMMPVQDDPFFKQNAMSVLVPVAEEGFEAEYVIPFQDYVGRLHFHYRNFTEATNVLRNMGGNIAIFNVATTPSITGDPVHCLVMPAPNTIVQRAYECNTPPWQSHQNQPIHQGGTFLPVNSK